MLRSDDIDSWFLLLANIITPSKISLASTSYYDGNIRDLLSWEYLEDAKLYLQVSLLQLASIIYFALSVSQDYFVITTI